MVIGIDKSDGRDVTVYTIPHEIAFEMLQRQVCEQFEKAGSFETNTRAKLIGSELEFTITVKRIS